MIAVEALGEAVALHEAVGELEQLRGAEVGVHALVLPLLGIRRQALPQSLRLRLRQRLGVLLAGGGGEEDDVVDGLDQLQLHHAADQQAGEQLVLLLYLQPPSHERESVRSKQSAATTPASAS